MNLFWQSYKLLASLALALMLVFATSFGVQSQSSLAVASPIKLSDAVQPQLILADTSLGGRTEAVGKNIQGKVQETFGNITGNPSDQAAGKAKQAESQVRHSVENTKDFGRSANRRTEATGKNLAGKVQEAVGNITGNRGDQAAGKAKQAESGVRHAVEDLRNR